MWEAFWPLKGMKMQPTKKMSIGKLILAAVATACATMSATGDAREYHMSPEAVYGTTTTTNITTTVADSMKTIQVEYTPNPSAATSSSATILGRMTIDTLGKGAAPKGYLLSPCNDTVEYEVTVNGREADWTKIEMRDTEGTTIGPRHGIEVSSGGLTTPVDVVATNTREAGLYAACVRVTSVTGD